MSIQPASNSTGCSPSTRRGFASVLAMLYLVLFSTLALGFYTATTMSAQVARNERSLVLAQSASESGMRFMRYQMGAIVVPPTTTNDQLLSTVCGLLQTNLNGTSNLNGDTVALSSGVINIPSNTSHFITADASSGAKFRAVISQAGSKLVCTVYGQGNDANVSRAVQLSFSKAAKASAIFNYGVASKGKITTGGASYILGSPDPAKGSVLSTSMSTSTPVVVGGKKISGDISISNPAGTVTYSGASIGGTTDPAQIPDHIHIGVTPPLFPYIDATPYTQAVTLTTYSSGNNLVNAKIAPNTNPTFTGNTTISGVLYVQAPNVVTFKGNTTVQGVIVVDNSAALDLVKNKLVFSGSVTGSSVSTLPNNATYTNLRSLTGAFILAPNFALSFSGNFGTVAGSIIASQISMTGNATGTVQGSVINVDDVPMTINGSADIIIASTGTSNYPAGVSFGSYYTPLPDTYSEIVP